MTQDLYYYENGYIEDGYFGYTADAEANFELTCSISAVISVIKETTVELNSVFTQICVFSAVNGSDMFAFTEASLAAEVSRIRDNNTQIDSLFDISAIGLRVRYVSAQCDTDAAISFDQIRIRTDEAAIDAAFSFAVLEEIIKSSQSLIESNFNLNVEINLIREVNSVLDSNFDLTFGLPDFPVDPNIIRDVSATLNSSFTLITNSIKLINFVVHCDALFSPTITCNPIRNHFAHLDLTATLTTNISIFKNVNVSLQSRFTETVSYKSVKAFSSSLQSNAKLSFYGTYNNKRPRSITPVDDGSYTSNMFTDSPYGQSLITYNNNRYFRIENKSKTPIASSQKFYIGLYYSPLFAGTNGSILNADAWEIGSTSSTIYFRYNSTTISVTTGSTYNQTYRIEVYRSGSTITLKVTNYYTSTIYSTTLTSSASATPTNDYIKLGSASQYMIIDELFFSIGESQIYAYKPNGFDINDGWRSTTQFLYHFNNDLVDDMSGGIYNVPAALISNATLTCDAIKSIYGSANLQSSTTLVCNAIEVPIEFDAIMTSSFTQSAVGTKVLYATATLNTTVGFTINEIIIKSSSVSMSAFVTEMVIVSRKVGEVANLTTNATLVCNSTRIRKLTSGLGSNATLVCNSTRIRKTNSSLSVTLTLVCNSVRTRKTSSTMNAFVTEMVIVTRRKEEVANLTTTATLTASFGVLGFNRSHPIANFTVIATNDRVRKFEIQSQSTFNLSINISKSISTNAVLLTTTSLLAIGTRFYLDPELTYIIPNESREWIIQYEDRTLIIEQEDRTHIIGK